MQIRQSLMSPQVVIALLHAPPSKFGHVEGHPIEASESLSPTVLQVLSSPPHFLLTPARSLLSAFTILPAAVGSRRQSWGGIFPLTIASRHFCSAFVLACTYFDVSLAIS